MTVHRKLRWSSLAMLLVSLVLAAPLLFAAPDRKTQIGGFFFALCALVFAFDFFRSFSSSSGPKQPTASVAFSSQGISATYVNGETRSVAWSELSKVGVTTTDEGPLLQDVFWGLHAGDQVRVVYPSDAEGAQKLLQELQSRLQGFNNELLLVAMGSATNAHFVLWERANGGA